MISDPITLTEEKTIRDALDISARYHIGGVPIVREDGYLVGLITNRDLKYETDLNLPVTARMTPGDKLITASPGITLDKAKHILHQSRKEKLPIVDDDFKLCGLITIKDIDKVQMFPQACKDEEGRLRVGAAIQPSTPLADVELLVNEEADVLVLDTAHGHSKNVIRSTEILNLNFQILNLLQGMSLPLKQPKV